ncbi:hypothetical protein B7463_g8349, partial [Scytalidium lignicola]
MSVTSPAPVPGKPFTLTWTRGQPTEAVYIVLNSYFPPTTNQNIIYFTNSILSNAPNNGSWTWNVPLNIDAGRHSFGIGYNPILHSDTSDIFVIDSSETSSVPPGPTPTNVAGPTYQGCGLPPLPDYTYTGYQPPCTITTSGRVETIYPIVPASLSSIFYGRSSHDSPAPGPATSARITTTSTSTINPAFATGVFAQALQCPNQVTPSETSITASGVTTIFSTVACNTAVPTASVANSKGMCHASGYETFSVSGTSSVCCPDGWATTPLNSEMFCFISTETSDSNRRSLFPRQVSAESSVSTTKTPVVKIFGLVFTSAGIVTKDVAAATGSPSTATAAGNSAGTITATGSTLSAATTTSGSAQLYLSFWEILWIAGAVGIFQYAVM